MNAMDLITGLNEIQDSLITDAEAFRSQVRHTPHLSGRKLWLAAAIITLLLLLVGCAVVYVVSSADWYANRWYPKFFSGDQSTAAVDDLTESQQEVWEHGLIKIDQSVTCNGYTITLESGISDGCRMLVKYRIDAPDGIILDADTYFIHFTTDMQLPSVPNGNFALGSYGSEPLSDNDPGDGSISQLFEWILQPPEGSDFSITDGSLWTITFQSIQAENGSGENYERKTICEGTWKFNITFSDDLLVTQSVELLDKPVHCSAVRSFRNGHFPLKVKVTSFELRALSATVCYNIPLTGFWDGVRLNPICLVMQDGTRIEARFKTFINRGDHAECLYLFDRPVAAEDVAYIDFP